VIISEKRGMRERERNQSGGGKKKGNSHCVEVSIGGPSTGRKGRVNSTKLEISCGVIPQSMCPNSISKSKTGAGWTRDQPQILAVYEGEGESKTASSTRREIDAGGVFPRR